MAALARNTVNLYVHIILEASVARFSDISLSQISRSRSCRQTAARELRPDDIVLSTTQRSITNRRKSGKRCAIPGTEETYLRSQVIPLDTLSTGVSYFLRCAAGVLANLAKAF